MYPSIIDPSVFVICTFTRKVIRVNQSINHQIKMKERKKETRENVREKRFTSQNLTKHFLVATRSIINSRIRYDLDLCMSWRRQRLIAGRRPLVSGCRLDEFNSSTS